MKNAFRSACLSAAAITTLYGVSPVHARPLQWDATGTSAPTGADGDGTWDLTNTNWVDLINGVNTVFQNGDDVTIGLGGNTNTTNSTTFNVITLGSNITAGNVVFRPATNGNPYAIIDNGSQIFTLNGNIVKTGTVGGTNRFQLSNAMVLSAGNHVVSLSDSPGDVAGGELTINNPIAGTGSLELNNVAGLGGTDSQYGTFVLLGANSYTGGTNVASGRLIINNNAGLGTGAVTVSGGGFLAFGGPGAAVSGGLTFTNPLTITRSDYGATGDTNFSRYTSAVGAANGSGINTISGPVTIDSTEGRFRADTSRLIISSDIQRGTTVAAGTPVVLGLDGDNAGFIELTGNNTGISGIRTLGGVQVEFANQNNIGGPNSSITFNGGVLRPIAGALTNFGTHTINNATFSGGIAVDDTYSFTVDQPLGDAAVAVGAISKRGLGTLNLNSTINLRGAASFFDAGVVNINGSTTLFGSRLRSPTVNIGTGATFATTNGYTSIGIDTFGTNGAADNATVNITGNGVWNAGDFDFNVSDNAQTKGTVNISDTAQLNVLGNFFAAKSTGTTATITQSGTSRVSIGAFDATTGAATSVRNLVIGRGSATVMGAVGSYTKTGGTLRVAGEMQVGADINGVGSFSQSAGETTANNWFATGRFGAQGTTDISGGTFTKNGTQAAYVGENTNAVTSTFTVRGTGVYNQTVGGGEFWVGQGGGIGILNIQDTASFTVNNWLALGRANVNSKGTLNLSGGTLTKPAGSPGFLAIGSTGQGTYNQTGGVANISGTRLAENSNGTMNISGGTATFINEFTLGAAASVNGTLNISGTANVTVPDALFGNAANAGGTINLDGGTLTGNRFASGSGTGGVKVFSFNGGTLRPLNSSSQTATPAGAPLIGPAITSIIRAGGAKIDTNGKDTFITSTLTQASGVTGTLAKSGLGTLRLASATASTYTGLTTVTGGGTLAANTVNYNNILTNGGVSLSGGLSGFSLEYTGGTSPVAQVKTILDAGYPNNFATGKIAATGLTGGRVLGYADDTTNSVVNVKVTINGDANLDGQVNFADFVALQGNFGNANTTFGQGNFNFDGTTNFADFVILQGNFGSSLAAGGRAEFSREEYAAVMSITNASQVPEPAALSVFAGAAALLGGRRRRTRA